MLSPDHVRQLVAEVAIFKTRGRAGEMIVAPPLAVVHDLLVCENPPLPSLKRIARVPCFSHDGRLIDVAGYHEEAEIYYQPETGLDVPAVPLMPGNEDLVEAKRLVDEVLHDFPFEGASDCAHAVALLLLPFARELIDGPTPIHAYDASTPGSGKGLLARSVVYPAVGEDICLTGQTNSEEEQELGRRL